MDIPGKVEIQRGWGDVDLAENVGLGEGVGHFTWKALCVEQFTFWLMAHRDVPQGYSWEK